MSNRGTISLGRHSVSNDTRELSICWINEWMTSMLAAYWGLQTQKKTTSMLQHRECHSTVFQLNSDGGGGEIGEINLLILYHPLLSSRELSPFCYIAQLFTCWSNQKTSDHPHFSVSLPLPLPAIQPNPRNITKMYQCNFQRSISIWPFPSTFFCCHSHLLSFLDLSLDYFLSWPPSSLFYHRADYNYNYPST